MPREVFKFTLTDEKTVEKVILDENINYIHMVLGTGEGFPEHTTDSTVYITVLRGIISIEIDGGETSEYGWGSILKIAKGSSMKGINPNGEVLELIVVKAPAPQN